jgi:hypothetical protein
MEREDRGCAADAGLVVEDALLLTTIKITAAPSRMNVLSLDIDYLLSGLKPNH